MSRLRRLVATLVAAFVVVPGSAWAEPVAPMPVPALAAETLDARYAASRNAITEARRSAQRVGDGERARRLRELAGPGRRFLHFDDRAGGRAVEVLGNLWHADRIAVLVPGSDTTLDTYDTRGDKPYAALAGAARGLWAELRRLDRDDSVAVVAWLGYDTPATISRDILTSGRAADGARELGTFVGALQRVNPSAGIALLCHSYGSVVCGRAAALPGVADLAVYGSPGMGVSAVSELRTGAWVWAGRGRNDWTALVPHVTVSLLGTTVGFGADPVAPGFGARVFDAGGAGHSDYFAPGSVALRNLALIALGHHTGVSNG
jgi:Alpha/beta hydrolase